MKIAVVGSGISGLGAALALSEKHEVQLFERDSRVGGHANTVEVAYRDGMQPVDTGFIVYNQRNYPNLCAFFEHLEVPTRWSDMSFGFSLSEGRCEYACDSLDKIFAQRWRALDPRFVGMAREILRFTKVAPNDMAAGRLAGLSLGEWLGQRGFGRWFRERFLLPMGGAIWSTSAQQILDFPAVNFVNFFCNHDLMTGLDAAQRWRTVEGGSREYVRRAHARLGPRVLPGREAVRVITTSARPKVRFSDGAEEAFDQVVLAVHAPDALRLLDVPDDAQAGLLGAFRTTTNRAVLHSDTRLMPKRRRVWSSWNFLADAAEYDGERPAQVTYWMNRLQGIREDRPLFVSLNARAEIDPIETHAVFDYAHPFFDQAAFDAQGSMDTIQGRGGVWYAGAWLGYGFHEDGLRAGLRVAAALGSVPDWAADLGRPMAEADAA
ncbi:MAG: FAD-dependent oxidoreductase [Pseudomonadota bacterium]